MPKLLQINSVINSGSTGRIAEEIGNTAISNNWESYIAYGRYKRPSQSKLIRIGKDWDIRFHGLQTRFFDKHGFGSVKATHKLLTEIETIKPDIIHLHNLHGYYLNIEILFNFLQKSSIPVVWTLHDCWSITGHCPHFEFIGCEKWKTECHHCPQKKEYPASLFLDRSRKNFQQKKALFTSVQNMTIVPVSDWLHDKVSQSFMAKCSVQVINNGIDIKLFSPQLDTQKIRTKYGIGNRFMLIGVATSWSNRKGLQDYIELSKTLSTDTVIVLVGISKAIAKILPERIIGIPRTESTTELAQLYSAANIVLNLSVEESFGLTTVEGFACGTPGIVYNCTASPELMTPETGFIVNKGDLHALSSAIETIKSNGKEHYSIACRDRAVKLYNKNDRYMDYINLYESIIGNSK